MTDHELEQLRRSLAAAPGDKPATALTNHQAEAVTAELQQLRKLANSD